MGSRTRQKQFEDNIRMRDMVDKVEINPNGPMFKVTPVDKDEYLESISPWRVWKFPTQPKKMSIREYVDAHTVHESWGRDEFPLRGALWPK